MASPLVFFRHRMDLDGMLAPIARDEMDGSHPFIRNSWAGIFHQQEDGKFFLAEKKLYLRNICMISVAAWNSSEFGKAEGTVATATDCIFLFVLFACFQPSEVCWTAELWHHPRNNIRNR